MTKFLHWFWIHNYGKWIDITLASEYGKEAGQMRYCEVCNKKQLRSAY